MSDLGSTISWTIKPGDYSVEKIKEALRIAGLPDYMLEALSLRRAFQRAARKIAADAAVDKIPGSTNLVTFQLSKRYWEHDGGKQVAKYGYSAQVTLDCETGSVTADDDEVRAAAERALTHAVECRPSSDLNQAVKKIIERNSDIFAINPQKGVVYFSPAKSAEYVAKVKEFVCQLGGIWHQMVVPSGDKATNLTIAQAIEHGLAERLSELARAVETFGEDTGDKKIENHVQKYRETKAKIEGYAALLESKAHELLKKAEEEEAQLLKKIETLTATSDA